MTALAQRIRVARMSVQFGRLFDVSFDQLNVLAQQFACLRIFSLIAAVLILDAQIAKELDHFLLTFQHANVGRHC